MPFSLLNERSQGQSSGVTRRGGGRGKSDDLSTSSSRQKGHHALEKFEEGSLVWTEASVRTTKRQKKKELLLKSHHYLFGRHILKF